MPRPWKSCLVGCGRMGATIDDEVCTRPDSQNYLPYSHAAGHVAAEGDTLVAVSDALADKAETIRQRYGAERAYTDYREMIEKEKPDILSIATRPTPYAEICIFAAEHGVKGIYCEKPLARSLEEADRMVEACERNGVKFNYGTQRRYAPMYRKMRDLIDAGELGDIRCVVAYGAPSAAFWGLTHATDMILCLAGDAEIDFVQGSIVVKDENWESSTRLNVDPTVTSGYAQFKNGVRGYLVSGSRWEFEVIGTKGTLRSRTNGLGCEWRRECGPNVLPETVPFPEYEPRSGTLCLVDDLVGALDTGGDTLGPIQLARRSFEMMVGFIESSRQGGARVPVPVANRALYIGPETW